MAHGLSCSAACGIFLDQGSNLCPLDWQADSSPLVLWVLSLLSHVRLLATPWTIARQAPVPLGILQARILEWVAASVVLQSVFLDAPLPPQLPPPCNHVNGIDMLYIYLCTGCISRLYT